MSSEQSMMRFPIDNADVIELTPILQNYADMGEPRHLVLIGNIQNRPGLFWSTRIKQFAPAANTFFCADGTVFDVTTYGMSEASLITFRRSLYLRSAKAKVVTQSFLLEYCAAVL